MKALKIWSRIVLALAIGIFSIGLLSGEFREFYGIFGWGDSPGVIMINLGSWFCLLLYISLSLVIHAIESSGKELSDLQRNRTE